MFCSNCGNKLSETARFCAACGMALAATATPAAADPAPAAPQPVEARPPPPDRVAVRTEAEFRAFYENTLRPELVQIDEDRKRVRSRILIVWGAALFIAVLAFAVGQTLEGW